MKLSRRALFAIPALALWAQNPPRLRRRDSYFGLHFDLHPQAEDRQLGRDVTEAMIEELLRAAKPDYVQYDCKGHAGWLGYQSAVSKSPGIVQDSLALWRKVTARRGVALYVHFSGVWDSLAVAEHPEWARVTADGKRDDRNTSTFSAYVDERMIPQLREVSKQYDLDGVWVDGECWSTQPDYGEKALSAWGRPAPRKAGEAGWNEFLEFNREQFRRYVRHYCEVLHRERPQFQIASNWLYSTYVPEKPDLPVDFLSGDYLGNAPISTAHLESRYLAATGKPWDLMAWGFQVVPELGQTHKPAVQLQQEAAIVLAQGGGFQIYYQPTRTGYFDRSMIATMGEVGAFCRERQAWSQGTATVPQVAVVFSRHSLYRTANKMFGGWGAHQNPARGWLDALLAAHYSVDVLPDWALDQAALYPAVVVPDWPDLGAEARDALLAYVRQGGHLVLSGAENARLFDGHVGAELVGEASKQEARFGGGSANANVPGEWQSLKPTGAEVIETRYATTDLTREGQPGAVLATLGRGRIVTVPGPVGRVYATTHTPAVRQLVERLMGRVLTPLVELTAPPTVEMAIRQKGGRLLVHLVNTSNMQVAAEYTAVDFVPPVGPVGLKVAGPVRQAWWRPDGTVLPVRVAGRTSQVEVPRLGVHGVVELEWA